MDRERFDALARLLGASGSRRGTLGALLSGALLGTGFDAAAKNRNKNKNKNKKKKAQTCFGANVCEFPSDGQEFENCNHSGSDIEQCNGCDFRRADLAFVDFNQGSYQGVSFREANLRSADLSFTDVSGASFRDACLVGADFFGANTDGAHFGDAILCNTTLPDGSIDDSGCDDTDDCCPFCLFPGQSCGEGIDGACCDSDCINGVCVGCLKDTDCPSDEFCCGNVCIGYCCQDSQCPQPGFCIDGVCAECQTSGECPGDEICCSNLQCQECCNDFSGQCAAGESCCEGSCVDTDSDPFNCGSCLVTCFTDEQCVEGECVPNED